MGHWSESLLEDAATAIGGNPDRDKLRELLVAVGQEIDVLAGRTFGPVRRTTVDIETAGLPFAEIPDLQRDSLESDVPVRAVFDPVNPQVATVLQVIPRTKPVAHAVPVGHALFVAGQIVADFARRDRLSGDYVLHWLASVTNAEERPQLLRRLTNPAFRFNVPVFGLELGGWWFQVTRRLIWVTDDTDEDGRLVEPLFDEEDVRAGRAGPLCAGENVLIAARLTSQPVDWAFSARIWTKDVKRPINRPWQKLARAIHGHGIPVITIDSDSTQLEVGCQMLLKAYWHGYISGDEPGLARAVAQAFPKQVERVRRGTLAPDNDSAAATLLEGLLYPGFDPARGAEANRRYVSRKASIAVMNHRKREFADRQPWTRLGIGERRYYKLLPQFAPKINGRYEINESVLQQMRRHLDGRDRERSVRIMAMDVLQQHGFGLEATRKWLQRHRPEEAVNAWPRGSRGGRSEAASRAEAVLSVQR